MLLYFILCVLMNYGTVFDRFATFLKIRDICDSKLAYNFLCNLLNLIS